MNAFELSEQSGRQKARTALEQHLKDNRFTIVETDGYCRWDFEIYKNGKLVAIVEAKDRKFASTNYKVREGVQLEEMKYTTLVNTAKRRNITAYYIATFTDGKALMWNLCTAPYTEDDRMCNKTTAEDNGKVMKHCYYFQRADSII